MIACDSNSGGDDSDDETPQVNVKGDVAGAVQHDGTGMMLPGITVTIGSLQTTTDSEGRFSFKDVAGGSKNLQVTTTGYDSYSATISVKSGTNSHNISLIRTAHYQYQSDSGDFDLYLPPSVSTFRGVIFLGEPQTQDARGFAHGNSVSGAAPGLNVFVAAERARSLQLAEKHGLALLGSRNTARGPVKSTIQTALNRFAADSAHPELAQAPVLATGFSWGGCISFEFAKTLPERTIGFITGKGQCHDEFGTSESTRSVPGYLFIGESDLQVRFENISALFNEHRALGALWALAIEQGSDHVPVVDQTLLYNWEDFILGARLPASVVPGEPVVLNPMNEASGWLGNWQSFEMADFGSYTGDKLTASWVPSLQTAQDWQTFVSAPPGKKENSWTGADRN